MHTRDIRRGHFGVAAALLLGGVSNVVAQTTTVSTSTTTVQLGSAHIIEWDLPVPIDFNPGAVVVDTRGEDNNRAWFVTRLADTLAGNRKVYRFDFQPSLMKNNGSARWTSFDLAEDVINNGGIAKLRPSHDRRFAIVRTSSSIQEVDTQACPPGTPANPTLCAAGLRRFDFSDPESPDPNSVFVSDIAVDDSRRVFTVGRSQAFQTGYLQMLIPTKVAFTSSTNPINAPAGTVTRWRVDGVDQCLMTGDSGFCNSGVDFQPSSQNQNLIYVSDQGFEQVINGVNTVTGAIAEVNIANNQIRRWPMPLDTTGQPVAQPRQLKIDSNGIVWVVTGSGHLVSLNPKNSSQCPNGTNRITRHRIPPEALQNDGFGVAPDSNTVGYTDANNNKVGMLLPRDAAVCVAPVPDVANKLDIPTIVTTIPTLVASDVTPGIPKNVLKKTTRKPDGTFVEAVINTPAPNADPTMTPPSSMQPLGITPIKWKGQGTFFYAVGVTAGVDGGTGTPSFAKRVGFVRLGVPERINNPRDDEDADDGFDAALHPTWHVSVPGDSDADGVPDQFDSSNKENMTGFDPAPLAASAVTSYQVTTTASSLALMATAQADVPTATIAVDVYNALGTLVATSGPLVGVAAATVPTPGAGNFTVQVRNLSMGSVNITPTLVVREPLVP
jgi:hypothetical protein